MSAFLPGIGVQEIVCMAVFVVPGAIILFVLWLRGRAAKRKPIQDPRDR